MECSFCGRAVRPTWHRRDGSPLYLVDYYMLLTGQLQKMTMRDPLSETEVIEFHKLTSPRWVISCIDCFAQEDRRRELERLFSGLPGDAEAEAAGEGATP